MAVALEFSRFFSQSARRVQTAAVLAAKKRRSDPLQTSRVRDKVAATFGQIGLINDPPYLSVPNPIDQVGFWKWNPMRVVRELIKLDWERPAPTIWQGMRKTVVRYLNLQILTDAPVNPRLNGWMDASEGSGFIRRYMDTED